MALLSTVASQYSPPAGVTTVFREQLEEIATIVDPFNTPVEDMLPGGKAVSTVVQWIVDTLPALVTNVTNGSVDVDGININGISEGSDSFTFTNYYSAQPSRVTNYTQIWMGRVGVSDTLYAGQPAAIKNAYLWDAAKVTKSIKKAIERRYFDNASANANYTVGRVAVNSTTPALTKTFDEFITTNVVTVSGTLAPSHVDTGMEAAERSGGAPEYLVVGLGTKVDFSQAIRLAGNPNTASIINLATISAAERRAIRAVDFYEGDFGTVAVMACRHIPETATTSAGGAAFLFERAKLGKLTYRPMAHVPLGKTGDNTKGYIVVEQALKVANEKALVKLIRVTT